MATIVAAFGVPHTPAFPSLVAREGPGCEVARLYRALQERLASVAPDLVVLFTTDHLNTFFFDAWPIFAIGIAASFQGPNDSPAAMPASVVASHAALAAHLRTRLVAAEFDVALANGISLDHSAMVPLHFLTPGMDIPVIPVFINGHLPPMPSAARCHALGQAMRVAVEGWPEPLRVAVIGSGSFSLEVHGPLMQPGLPYGVPDPAWARRVRDLLEAGDISRLVAETTPERIAGSGNVAGEILNWIAMAGAYGDGPPESLAFQPCYGHGYAAWVR